MGELDELKRELDRCFRCGLCQAVCPTFRSTGDEAQVARARMVFMSRYLRGDLKVTRGLVDLLDDCLGCKACMSVCPAGVPFDRLVAAARHDWKRSCPDGLLRKAALCLLGNARAARSLVRLLSPLEKITTRPSVLTRYRHPRAFLGRSVIQLPEEPFLGRTAPQGQEAFPAKVAYFVGCMADLAEPSVARDTVAALNRLRVGLLAPTNQGCCGLPHLLHGYPETAKRLAEMNVRALEATGAKDVIATCPSCVGMLTDHYPRLIGRDLPFRVWEAVEFVEKSEALGSDLPHLSLTVTFHDPCHLTYSHGSRLSSRRLLSRIPGLSIKEMRDSAACCGGGGLNGFTRYEKSIPITDAKIQRIKETGCKTVVTPCSACAMQISDGLIRNGIAAEVVHPMRVLAAALQTRRNDERVSAD